MITIKTENKPDKNQHNNDVSEPEIETNTTQNIDPKDAQIADLTNTLKRLQAEFENYKKRSDKEYANHVRNANAELIKELLSVLDSFELALKNDNCTSPEIAKYRKGIELIYSQLYSLLEDYGLRIIDTKNQKFDPFRHEVLMVKECSEKDDLILQEFQKGYFLNDNVLRHSKVMIAKHVEEKKE